MRLPISAIIFRQELLLDRIAILIGGTPWPSCLVCVRENGYFTKQRIPSTQSQTYCLLIFDAFQNYMLLSPFGQDAAA